MLIKFTLDIFDGGELIMKNSVAERIEYHFNNYPGVYLFFEGDALQRQDFFLMGANFLIERMVDIGINMISFLKNSISQIKITIVTKYNKILTSIKISIIVMLTLKPLRCFVVYLTYIFILSYFFNVVYAAEPDADKWKIEPFTENPNDRKRILDYVNSSVSQDILTEIANSTILMFKENRIINHV